MTWTRRQVLQAIALPPVIRSGAAVLYPSDAQSTLRCPIRTITAGVTLANARDLRPIEAAVALLRRARQSFEAAGYEVQTLRIATSAVIADLSARQRDDALAALQSLDQLLQESRISGSIGPCSRSDLYDRELAPWIAQLFASTTRLRCSIRVAIDATVDTAGARMAAEAMVAISRATPEGEGNFRFAAAACIPPGTPFYPVAFHEGEPAIAIGLESASIVERALTDAPDGRTATARVRDALNEALAPIERLGESFARGEGWGYRGIDSSPAPALQRSIGAAIEAYTKQPFGEAGTLQACAAVTAALRTLSVTTCGYSGLMLPPLEDRVLASRASEGRFGLQDLLLFSSVCGTGLDVVPIPGATSVERLQRIILDTAALASRWQKPLSARLYLVPGKQAGELAKFSDPELTECRVMPA